MWRNTLVLGFLVCSAAAGQAGRPATAKPLIECDSAELLRAAPELAGIEFDAKQDGLGALLDAAGDNLYEMLGTLVDVSATEQIREMHFDASMARTTRRETFRYVVQTVQSGERFTEFRADPATGAAAHPPKSDFLVIGHFLKLVRYLLPEFRKESTFRYLGRSAAAGGDLLVVAFAQRPDSTQSLSHVGAGDGSTSPLQGIVWLDAASHRIVRLRADLLGRTEGSPLESLTTDVTLVPVSFPYIGCTLWLPDQVTVRARYLNGELDSVHRYSDYRLYGVDDKAAPELTEKLAGVTPAMATPAEDAWELLDRGISLAENSKPNDALSPLREAVRLDPEVAAGHYYLAAAMRAAGDFTGAEAELRAAVNLAPDSGPVHNLLGILLLKRGAVASAIAEFRAAAQFQPKDATVHYNLARALEGTGDRKAALEEYRTASTLAPDDTGMKARYEQFERAANVPPAPVAVETSIKVDVRQVLVPVVVRDKDGHHVTGLTQADFRVFEDGVEQKIAGFSVETAGVSSAPPPESAASPAPIAAAPAATPPAQVPVRRTYLICIDALHTGFASLAHIREALSKLFQGQRAGDAQYIVVSIGTSTQVLQNPTSDPESVLKMVDSKEFQKSILGSRRSALEDDLQSFRRSLDQTRNICDTGLPQCQNMKRLLPSQAGQIAEQDRAYALAFVGQFRSLVEQLLRGGGRRTIILLSDGFPVVPGRLAFELLAAYFPELHSLRTTDRMPDLEPVLRLAANGSIPIYTIDSRGLYASPDADASGSAAGLERAADVLSATDRVATEAGQTLAEMAAATGGTAFQNSNNIFNGLQRAFADGREYYLLAYVPTNSDPDGKFRAIAVRVRDGKFQVSAKRGYWPAGPPK